MSVGQAGCVLLPLQALARLGPLRARPEVRAVVEGERLWVFWPAGDAELAHRLLGLPGAVLFEEQGDHWMPLGASLPCFDVPDRDRGVALPVLLVPARIEPEPPGEDRGQPVRVRLVEDDHPQPTTALQVDLQPLLAWAETATSRQLAGLTAAHQHSTVLLRGQLPPLLGARFWGNRVLIPVGRHPEPALDEGVLVAVLGLEPGETALLSDAGAEVLPEGLFTPVSRAGLRILGEGARHAR